MENLNRIFDEVLREGVFNKYNTYKDYQKKFKGKSCIDTKDKQSMKVDAYSDLAVILQNWKNNWTNKFMGDEELDAIISEVARDHVGGSI